MSIYGRELFVLFYTCGAWRYLIGGKVTNSSAHFLFIIMKRFILSLFALVCVTMSFAQSSLLATLSHDGNIKTFYGAKALIEAHNAAENGDVITLSSGSFVATDIEKALTIRGAGMEADSVNGTLPTIITGSFNIQIPDTVSERITLEGIYNNQTIRYNCTLNKPMFLKCRFAELRSANGNKIIDASFIHCRITEKIYLDNDCSASCVNSIIADPERYSMNTSNFEFTNCFIYGPNIHNICSSSFRNSIIITGRNEENYDLDRSVTAFNCVGDAPKLFNNIPNTTNKIAVASGLFKTYKGGNFNDSDSFELTDEAKTKFLGTDGTQVGIYGGMLPYDPTPSNPHITKCNVAAKSTADGKLSVDIEVKAAE
mgnify:CR=1 FL=1